MEKHFIEVLFSVISAFGELNKASGCALILLSSETADKVMSAVIFCAKKWKTEKNMV